MSKRFVLFLCATALFVGSWDSSVFHSAWSSEAAVEISLEKLRDEIAARRSKVQEFVEIAKIAESIGVQAWLFGGTAAAYAHYVYWDLLREGGDQSMAVSRFDYDYTNIFRSTQDLDVVVDGTEKQARLFQEALEEKFPYFQGHKSRWEVRLLRSDFGDKLALLNNPDFLNQHTDSNSTGLIELTSSTDTGEAKAGSRSGAAPMIIKDLRDWKNGKDPIFLKDIHDRSLHFYFGMLHENTSRFKEGLNPPIMAAIRYLTKAFQYDLKISGDDLRLVQAIIDDFDQTKLDAYLNTKGKTAREYVYHWLEKNGTKLFAHAVDIEKAWDFLERSGLRRKLIAMGNIRTRDSLAWWMNKEPLRSRPVGLGDGKTAQELGIDVVAHETNSFLAWESITRAPWGATNVFISRDNITGEAALFGDGFYTQRGRVGARGTGITIRFTVSPNARLGTDFILENGFIIFRNKNALRVIPESLEMTPLEYFQRMEAGLEFDFNDRGQVEKLARRVRNRLNHLEENEFSEIESVVRHHLLTSVTTRLGLLQEWFALPRSVEHPEHLKAFLARETGYEMDFWVMSNVLEKPHWQRRPEFLGYLISRKSLPPWILIEFINKHLEWLSWDAAPRFVFAATSRAFKELCRTSSSSGDEASRREWNKSRLLESLKPVLSSPQMLKHPKIFVDLLGTSTEFLGWLFNVVAASDELTDDIDVFKKLIDVAFADRHMPPSYSAIGTLRTVLDKKKSHSNYLELKRYMYSKLGDRIGMFIGELKESEYKTNFDKDPLLREMALEGVFDQTFVKQQPLFDEVVLKDVDILESIIDRGENIPEIVDRLAATAESIPAEVVRKLINKGEANARIAEFIISKEKWATHPELIEAYIRVGVKLRVLDKVLSKDHWKNQPNLRDLCGGANPTVERLQAAYRAVDTHLKQSCSGLLLTK
jgi:hypothetical protein